MKIPMIQFAAIQPKAQKHRRYSDCRPLPPSYMSEHSVLGLIVGEIDRAIEILNGNGFLIEKEEFGAEVEISGPDQFPEVMRILGEAGVYGSIGDVIDSVYQG